jgi:YggT family protein
MIARLIFDYIRIFARSWQPKGVVLLLAELVYTLTDPPLRFLRRFIPPLRLGGVSLDLSFLVLIIVLQILLSFARRL